MFQVQSQPASPFNLQMERATHAVHVPNPALNLPRKLQRPIFREVDMRRVVAHFPELGSEGCPAPYVKNVLVNLAKEYVASPVCSLFMMLTTGSDISQHDQGC